MSRKLFFILGLITILGFSSIGAIIIEIVLDKPFLSVFEHETAWYLQVILGLFYGLLTGWIAWQIVKSDLLTPVRSFFAELIQDLFLKYHEIVFISFCAGVGEEILFRGAIQPLIGIWITAILFVALHGYINPFNWRLSIYGIVMCLFIAGLGLMCEQIGLISAISAHFAIDVVLLLALTRYKGHNIVN
ncbi:MAG: CPBP family intramembrane glutamic endopeptidase [Bacteroidota bacterium]